MPTDIRVGDDGDVSFLSYVN
ncbi:hypothetical protein, partial [Streptomyces violascens]